MDLIPGPGAPGARFSAVESWGVVCLLRSFLLPAVGVVIRGGKQPESQPGSGRGIQVWALVAWTKVGKGKHGELDGFKVVLEINFPGAADGLNWRWVEDRAEEGPGRETQASGLSPGARQCHFLKWENRQAGGAGVGHARFKKSAQSLPREPAGGQLQRSWRSRAI